MANVIGAGQNQVFLEILSLSRTTLQIFLKIIPQNRIRLFLEYYDIIVNFHPLVLFFNRFPNKMGGFLLGHAV